MIGIALNPGIVTSFTHHKKRCLVRSSCHQKHFPQIQKKFLSWDVLLAVQMSSPLHYATSSTATPHILDHLSRPWHTVYQSSIPMAFRSPITLSLHRFLVPWNGLFFKSSPNESCLEIKSAIDKYRPNCRNNCGELMQLCHFET